jgi:hypothetical protein
MQVKGNFELYTEINLIVTCFLVSQLILKSVLKYTAVKSTQ